MNSKERFSEMMKRLKKLYPAPKSALRFASPFDMVVATILSAQTTDSHVNKVTDALFRKYPTARHYADASLESLREDLRSINFYNTKARNIQAAARMIMEQFGGEVPKTMTDLTSLPGIARKTANIVLSNVYGINEGIAVDTHVKRLAQRLGLSRNSDPGKIEQDLMAMTARKDWANLSNLLILHGRSVCQARKPRHDECVLADICPSRDI